MIIPSKESLFTKIRESFWNYPDYLFARDGFLPSLATMYRLFRPFSHIVVFLILFIMIGFMNYTESLQFIRYQNEVLIEGVITGESSISKINPLLPTNRQIETDLSRMIYLPLIRVDSSGEVEGILADSWEQVDEEGKEYSFNLRQDVSWHDGERFNADDVITTFEILKSLGAESDGGIESKSAELAVNMEVIKFGNYSVLFRLDEIEPTFFEDIDVGIMPEHILKDVSLSTFSWASFNLNPVGTGPYIFESFKDGAISLRANNEFFLGKPEVNRLRIVLFDTGDEAVEALKTGEIHTLADPSTAVLDDLLGWKNLEVLTSSPLYRRYFGLYFNLKDGGPEVFQDRSVRKAISYAINKETILKMVQSAGIEADGPIPPISWAYNSDIKRPQYDLAKARDTLEKAGWEQKEIEGKSVLIKEDKILRFELSYLDKYEREMVAKQIKSDLSKLGIIVNLDPRNSSDLNEALIATRNFEAVLYGVETPIDPDRIRLWHSEAVNYPGLNIASYVSEEQGAIISDQELQRVSVVDVALENGRSSLDREKRKGSQGLEVGYDKFQEVLIDDSPIVFLYHPVFTYVVHKRVKGIDLSIVTAPEDRYLSVMNWRIE